MLNLSVSSSSWSTSWGSTSTINPSKQNPLFHHFLTPTTSSFFAPTSKNSSFSLSTPFKKLSLNCRHSDYFESSQQKLSPNDSSFPSPQGASEPKVFVGYSVYKGKAALTVEPRPPEFLPLDSGAFKLSREGSVMLQFAPAAGVRQYDWSRKQIFSLSVTEVGSLISLGAKDSCEFFHDPFKGKSDEGRVRKVLKVEPLPDGSGHFLNLSVQNRLINLDESIYIPITKAEFAVLTSAFNFLVPYLLGWHTFANSIKPEDSSRVSIGSRSGAEFEWSK